MKPFVLGCIAGCGVMFVGLRYHVVQSHDGLQLVPRAPQAALGLAWADVRDWDAEKWSDRPALARALVAHGASDLISDSIANEIGDSPHPSSGTIGQLRSLLNDTLTSDFDAPMFGDDDRTEPGSDNEDSLAIPFPRETRQPQQWDELFAESIDQNHTRTNLAGPAPRRTKDAGVDFSSEFSEFNEYSEHGSEEDRRSFDDDRSTRRRLPEFREPVTGSQATEFNSSWQSAPRNRTSSQSQADARVRETTILEDLLFSDEDTIESEQITPDSGFESVTRALDSRASRALDRASSAIIDNNESTKNSVRDGFLPNRSEPNSGGRFGSSPARNYELPHAVRALREGFDPFLD